VNGESEDPRGWSEGREPGAEGATGGVGPMFFGYEYRSRARLFGLPLVHVASGFDPKTGRMRVARGIIAIGNIAFGVLAIGGISFGILAFGGLALGIAVFGGLAAGLYAALGGVAVAGYWAVGGLAISGYVAVGGMAISWNYAFGGFAIGKHPYGSNYQDPAALEFLRRLFPGWKW